MREKSNLSRHEWIGLAAAVERAADPSLAGARGTLVDETMGTVTLERPDGREVRVPKRGTALTLTLPSGERSTLDLTLLAIRPWDRVKRAKGARASL